MKYLPTIALILGIAGVAFSPLCCREVRVAVFPAAAISPDVYPSGEGWNSKAFAETKWFLGMLGFGLVSLAFSGYLHERSKGGNFVDRVMMHARFCSKCGRPLRRRDCVRKKQFGFIPRLACPECNGYARWSSGVLMAAGLILTGGPFCLVANDRGKFLDVLGEAGSYLFISGFVIFMLGLLRHDRQHTKARHYLLAQKPSP